MPAGAHRLKVPSGDLLTPVLDRVALAIRRARNVAAPSRRERPAADDRLRALEERIVHLKAMIEGLQDSVHREALRANKQIDQLRERTDPAEITNALSRDARERGL